MGGQSCAVCSTCIATESYVQLPIFHPFCMHSALWYSGHLQKRIQTQLTLNSLNIGTLGSQRMMLKHWRRRVSTLSGFLWVDLKGNSDVASHPLRFPFVAWLLDRGGSSRSVARILPSGRSWLFGEKIFVVQSSGSNLCIYIASWPEMAERCWDRSHPGSSCITRSANARPNVYWKVSSHSFTTYSIRQVIFVSKLYVWRSILCEPFCSLGSNDHR